MLWGRDDQPDQTQVASQIERVATANAQQARAIADTNPSRLSRTPAATVLDSICDAWHRLDIHTHTRVGHVQMTIARAHRSCAAVCIRCAGKSGASNSLCCTGRFAYRRCTAVHTSNQTLTQCICNCAYARGLFAHSRNEISPSALGWGN